jgi:low affinity Fe/Cu permease
MDGEVVKTFAAAVAGGITSLAMLPMLFKGKLRFDREFTALQTQYEERIRVKNERHIEVVGLKNEEIARLQDGWAETQRELRETHALVAEQTKQVFAAIAFLQSLAGLAQKDRRMASRE